MNWESEGEEEESEILKTKTAWREKHVHGKTHLRGSIYHQMRHADFTSCCSWPPQAHTVTGEDPKQ